MVYRYNDEDGAQTKLVGRDKEVNKLNGIWLRGDDETLKCNKRASSRRCLVWSVRSREGDKRAASYSAQVLYMMDHHHHIN